MFKYNYKRKKYVIINLIIKKNILEVQKQEKNVIIKELFSNIYF